MELTDPRLFHFAPDTAHLHLGGSDVVKMFDKYRHRLVFMDYKDARWTTPKADVILPNGVVHKKDSHSAKFFDSIYDLGDGEIDFSGLPPHPETDRLQRVELRGPGPHPQRSARQLGALRRVCWSTGSNRSTRSLPGGAVYNKCKVGKFFVQNFGCRATQADGAALESQLCRRGHGAGRRTDRSGPGNPEYLYGHRRGR